MNSFFYFHILPLSVLCNSQDVLDVVYLIGLVGSVFFVWGFTMISSTNHKILRNPAYFKGFLYGAIVMAVAALLLLFFDPYFGETEKINSFAGFGPLTFLLLYRYFNTIIQRKLGRPIFFFSRSTHLNPDPEVQKQTSFEWWLQMLLSAATFAGIGIGYLLIHVLHLQL